MDTTLAHHGIKGQRWGVRRFQNKDGTLTPAGRKRKADPPEPTYEDRRKIALESHNANEVFQNLDTLSDKEIQTRVARLRNEQQLRDLASQQVVYDNRGKKKAMQQMNTAARVGMSAVNVGLQASTKAGYADRFQDREYLSDHGMSMDDGRKVQVGLEVAKVVLPGVIGILASLAKK